MEGYGQPAHGYGGDPYAAQAYGDGVGAYGAARPERGGCGGVGPFRRRAPGWRASSSSE